MTIENLSEEIKQERLRNQKRAWKLKNAKGRGSTEQTFTRTELLKARGYDVLEIPK
jgi:hypothetical protein